MNYKYIICKKTDAFEKKSQMRLQSVEKVQQKLGFFT